MLGLITGETEGDGVTDGVGLGDGEGEGLIDGLGDGLGDGVIEGDGVTEGEGDTLGVFEGVILGLLEGVMEVYGLRALLMDGETYVVMEGDMRFLVERMGLIDLLTPLGLVAVLDTLELIHGADLKILLTLTLVVETLTGVLVIVLTDWEPNPTTLPIFDTDVGICFFGR